MSKTGSWIIPAKREEQGRLTRFIISDTLGVEVEIMPTNNPRLNVVLEPRLYDVLNKLAHRAGVSLSMLARDLIKEALEEHEDLYWQKAAVEREKTFSLKKAKTHKDIWK